MASLWCLPERKSVEFQKEYARKKGLVTPVGRHLEKSIEVRYCVRMPTPATCEAYALESFLDQQLLEQKNVVFVLHGHGTGALKKGIREWLPSSVYVNEWRPAKPQEGGDAFTVLFL